MSIKLSQAIKKANLALLTCGSLGALALTGMPAFAESASSIEEIEVVGIRRSLQDSLNTKRFADSIVDAISAEDIGKFPDKNVAESLSRIPGVAVNRDYGEGEKISIRGSSSAQNRTLLNGSAVASADWYVLDNPSRAFNYSLLPSTVVSKLEVYKSPQADIQEGSLGGTVYLKTRKPLDLDSGTVSLQGQAQYSDASGEVDPQLSGLYSWKNDDETFGALISLTKQDRTVQRSGNEVLGHNRQTINGKDYWSPSAIGDAFFEQERERETAVVSLQFRPSDQTEIVANYLNSELSASNVNYNNYIWMNDQLGNGSNLDPSTIQTNGDHIVGGDVGDGAYAEYYVIERDSSSETESLDLELTHDAGNFIFTGKIGTTEAEGGTSSDKQYGFDRVLEGASFDNYQTTGYYDGGVEDTAALETRTVGYIQENYRIMTDEEKYVGFDFEFPVEVGAFTSFKTGMLYRDHDKAQSTKGSRFHWLTDAQHSADATEYGGGSDTSGWNRWLYGALDAGTLADYAVNGDAPFPLMDMAQVQSVVYPSEAYSDYATTTNFLFLPETWAVNEEITAAYFKADFESEGLRGNIGMRVVQTELSSTGYTWNGDWVAASINEIGGYSLLAGAVQGDYDYDYDVQQVTETNSYTNVLPNLNIAYDLTEDTILRASLARVMARPDYITIASQSASNLDTRTGSRGNPQLDPEIADQFDLSYEWYFAPEAMLTFTYFNKNIQNSVYNTIITESAFDPKLGVSVDVDYAQPTNGRGAEVQGLEIGYQQAFGNYGVVANYTFTDAESKDERDAVNNPGSGLVKDVSEHLMNLSGYYENEFMSARLSYNYRSEYYNGINYFGSEYYTEAAGQFDASASFTVAEGVDVVLEAVNLTDESVEQYHIEEGNPTNSYKNGRRLVVGVNMNF